LDIYLPVWTADNYYLYIWVPVILLTLLNKTIISLFITAGNLIGILAGQVLGDIIRHNNMKKITDSMPEGQKYYLRSHKGAYIWMLTIIISLLLGVAASIIYKKRFGDASGRRQ
jgi:membrane protein YqaA with SNARE-associated domain